MSINWQAAAKQLFSVARKQAPDDRVPPGFTQRVMARLRAQPLDPWALWADALWRPAFACFGFAVMVWVWAYFFSQTDATNLTDVYDATVYAVAEQMTDSW